MILLNPRDLNVKMERKRKIMISVLTFLAILPSYISTVPLEAAFQGRDAQFMINTNHYLPQYFL